MDLTRYCRGVLVLGFHVELMAHTVAYGTRDTDGPIISVVSPALLRTLSMTEGFPGSET